MKNIVERFSLEKAFFDEGTVDKLAMAGFRGQGHLTTFLFMRFATPIGVFALVSLYLIFVMYPDKPLFLNLVYAIGAAIIASFLPNVLLKNATVKRQASIRKAWP